VREPAAQITHGAAILIPAHFDTRAVAVLNQLLHIREAICVDHGVAVSGVLRAVDSLPAALPALIDADRGIANVSEGNQAAIDGPILSRDRINRAREGSASARAVVVVRATAAYQRRCAVGQGAV
jgi:hypothetical protein